MGNRCVCEGGCVCDRSVVYQVCLCVTGACLTGVCVCKGACMCDRCVCDCVSVGFCDIRVCVTGLCVCNRCVCV